MPHHYPARVARQAAGRFCRNVRAALEHGLAGRLRVRQHLGIDVDDDLVTVARRAGIDAVVEGGLREQGQRVRLLLGHRGRFRGPGAMLKASEQEREEVIAYVFSQARRERVQLAQKVYSERIGAVQHDIWDVHTSKGRWWVITSPMFLYSQRQFPSMDLALTFHIGLCVRVPRSDRPTLEDRQLEPLVACWRAFDEATAASERAEEVEDYQTIGVRCREVMVTLVHTAQDCIEGLGTRPRLCA